MLNFLTYLFRYIGGVILAVILLIAIFEAFIWTIIGIAELLKLNTSTLRGWAKLQRKSPEYKGVRATGDIDALIEQERERLAEIRARKEKQAELDRIRKEINDINAG